MKAEVFEADCDAYTCIRTTTSSMGGGVLWIQTSMPKTRARWVYNYWPFSGFLAQGFRGFGFPEIEIEFTRIHHQDGKHTGGCVLPDGKVSALFTSGTPTTPRFARARIFTGAHVR